MPSQADYNGPEASLVPEGLRAYRHFTAFPFDFDGHPLHLTPTTYQLRPMAQGGIYFPQYGPYEAECRRGSLDVPESHNAPDPRCKCGFYASYDPDTDFYPDNFWRKTDLDTSGGAFFVRAVVEMSGRTVMGTKGVRAQKMKIVAVAVDWDKFVWCDGDDPFELTWEVVGDRLASARYRRTPDPEELAEYEARASSLAAAYGARYFSHVADMHEAFPAPDVEHLKPKPVEPTYDQIFVSGSRVPGVKSVDWSTIQVTCQSTDDAFADVRKAFAKLSDATVTFTGTYETARGRALRLKRDPKRKGPASGKGIDYRK